MFWKTARLFSKVTESFSVSTSSVWRFQFLCILATTCYYLFFDSSQPSGYVLVLHCGFHLPIIIYSLEKCLFIYFAHIYSYPLSLLSCNNFIYSRKKFLTTYNFPVFSFILWVIFSFCLCTKVLILMMFSLFTFSFVAYAFDAIPKKTLPNTKPWRFMLVFFSTRFIVRFSSTRFSALIFRFLIHLDLIFVYGMKRRGPALPHVDM